MSVTKQPAVIKRLEISWTSGIAQSWDPHDTTIDEPNSSAVPNKPEKLLGYCTAKHRYVMNSLMKYIKITKNSR